MDIEQIIKQIDWLDEERRKDKTRLAALEERLSAIDSNVAPLANQIKELSSDLTRLTALISRMDHYEESVLQQRVETKQYFEELERQSKKRDDESKQIRNTEMRAIDAGLGDIRKELESIPELKRSMKSRVEEEARLARMIDEVRARLDVLRRSDEEYTRTYRLLDDGRRQDAKRMTDLQGEVSALRKRVDEDRGRIELLSNTARKIETRVNEFSTVETERREAIDSFLEKQALYQVERERVWKEWQARFEAIEAQTANVESNLQTLDATHRSVKRSQQTVDDLAQKIERRINEITEIQRLAEERFRQEWVTFKADDQKRWTNYTLTLEEQRNESSRQHEKLAEKMGHMDDTVLEIQDLIQQINEQEEKRLQSLLAMAHEWVSTYERTLGRAR
jgi:chromosome segregation ATPase